MLAALNHRHDYLPGNRQCAVNGGLGRDGDEPLLIGSDVASVGTDRRMARVVGFLDKVPTGATAND
jgi:hypothetical protein